MDKIYQRFIYRYNIKEKVEVNNIEKLVYSITNYIGIVPVSNSDYIIAFIIILFSLAFIVTLINDGNGFGILILAILIISIPIFFNRIKDGQYLAQSMQILNQKIGDGTNLSKKYNFIINKDIVKIQRYGTYILDKNTSTYYTKIYKKRPIKKFYLEQLKYSQISYLPNRVKTIKEKENIIDADISNLFCKTFKITEMKKDNYLEKFSKELKLDINSWGCGDLNKHTATILKITLLGNVGLYDNNIKLVTIKVFN